MSTCQEGKAISKLNVLEIGELGGGQETLLAKYLRERAEEFIFVEVLNTRYYKIGMDFLRISHYKEKELKQCSKYGTKWGFLLCFEPTRRALVYILCSIFIFLSLLRLRMRFHTCVAINCPFPAMGIVLRRLGLAKKLVFVSADHLPSPKGLTMNANFTRIYRLIDKVAQNSSDAVWYSCPQLIKVKKEEGIITNSNKQRWITPIGVDTERLRNNFLDQIERASIIYTGKLDIDIGLDLIIEAIAEVSKSVPNVKLKIIGSGPTEEELKRKAIILNLQENVEFLGFIGNKEEVMDLVSRSAISIAPYIPGLAYSIQYTDSGKAKEYIECGTPIIITKVPEIAFEIDEKRTGFAIEYDKEEITEKIMKLLTDDTLWQECRENIRQLAMKYDYKNIYHKAFQTIGIES